MSLAALDADPAFAQALDPATASAVGKVGLAADAGRSFNPFSSLQFTASQANSAASATLQLPEISGFSGPVAAQGSTTTGVYASYGYGGSISASVPVAKNSDSTNLATLSGFADSTNVTFQFSGYSGSSVPFGQFSDAARKMCMQATDAVVDKYNSANPGKPFQYDKDPKGNVICNDQTLVKVGAGDAARLTFASFGAPPSPLWFYGANGTVGYQSHTFYDAKTLAKSSPEKTPYGAGGYLTYVGASRSWSLTGQANYQVAYTDNTTAILCPAGGAAPVTCVNGPIGAPKESTKVLLAVEVRAYESWARFIPMGIAPMFTVDAKSKDYAFSMPLYLYTDGKNGLTGGVRGDWTSVKHDTVFGIFVTKTFDVGGHSTP